MGLSTLTQIPCHHVLSNEISLNLKYCIGLKHFFNINLGIGIIKKNYIFCLYFWHISPCFYSIFDQESSLGILLMDPATPKTGNTWKNMMMMSSPHFFQVFLVFGVAGSIKSMQCGYALDVESNSTSNEVSQSKFELKNREICQKYEQKK